MKRIGLFFGSFNPIHNGHLMLAQYMLNFAPIDEVWFVVSPQNPFKQSAHLAPAEHRIAMAQAAVASANSMHVSDIETTLPVPSYTICTLDALRLLYPDADFSIIMGADNLEGLHKWRDADRIMQNHRILVYPRHGHSTSVPPGCQCTVTDAPQIEISSTMLRGWIAQGLSIEHFVPSAVASYIQQHKLYGHQ